MRRTEKLNPVKDVNNVGSSHDTIPDKWRGVATIARSVFERLKEEGFVVSCEEIGTQLQNVSYGFNVIFSFWHRPRSVNFFLGRQENGCYVSQNDDIKSFNVLLGPQVSIEDVYAQFVSWVKIGESGLKFEDQIISDLNAWFLLHKYDFSVRKSTREEDEREKKDIFITSQEFSVGIQIKTGIREWVTHRRKYPHVPSLAIPKNYQIEHLVEKVLFIFNSFQEGRIEHVNMY